MPVQTSTPATVTQRVARLRKSNLSYRDAERWCDRAARQRSRTDVDVKRKETAARKTLRLDEDVQHVERSRDRAARQRSRSNIEVRRKENSTRQSDRALARHCTSIQELISLFHTAVSHGPTYVCSSCDQLFYKHSLHPTVYLRSLNMSQVQPVLLGTVSHDGIEYVCQTCYKYRNGLWPMQYVFLIRSSAGCKKYVTRRSRVTYFLPPARERIKNTYCMGQRPFLFLLLIYLRFLAIFYAKY